MDSGTRQLLAFNIILFLKNLNVIKSGPLEVTISLENPFHFVLNNFERIVDKVENLRNTLRCILKILGFESIFQFLIVS